MRLATIERYSYCNVFFMRIESKKKRLLKRNRFFKQPFD